MAEELEAKKVEVAGQMVCELIRKGVAPAELAEKGKMTVADLATVWGTFYEVIWKAIDRATKSKS